MAEGADLKLVLLGDKNVGKTTLFNQYMYGEVLKTQMTIGAYFTKKEFLVNNRTYDVAVWDTAGEEKFDSLTKFYTRGAHCAIVLYDMTELVSWRAVQKWCSDLDDACVILIAGNKLDLVEQEKKRRAIGFETVEKFAREKKALAIEGSAMTGYNVANMFQKVIEEYIARNGAPDRKGGASSVLTDKKPKDEDDGCCILL